MPGNPEDRKKKENSESSQQGAGQGGQGTEGTPKPSDQEGSGSQVEGAGGEGLEEDRPYEFQHPLLRGRSPEEIERLFALQESATNELGAKLTKVEAQIDNFRSAPPPKDEPTPKRNPDDFFADPEGRTEQIVAQHMEKAVEALRGEIRGAAKRFEPDAREALRQKFDDFTDVEPYIDHLLRQGKFPDPNDPKLLESLYYTSVGIRTKLGHTSPPRGEGGDVHRGPIPQHRASSPPKPPKSGNEDPRPRKLTESERRLARERKMSDEEYLKMQKPNFEDEESGLVFLSSDEE